MRAFPGILASLLIATMATTSCSDHGAVEHECSGSGAPCPSTAVAESSVSTAPVTQPQQTTTSTIAVVRRAIDVDLAGMRVVTPKGELVATFTAGDGDRQLGLRPFGDLLTGPTGMDTVADSIVIADAMNARWMLVTPTGIRTAPAGAGAAIIAGLGDEVYSAQPLGGPVEVYRPLDAAGTDAPVRSIDFTTGSLSSTGCSVMALPYTPAPGAHPIPVSIAQSSNDCPTYNEEYTAGAHLAMTVTTRAKVVRWSINGDMKFSTAKIRSTPTGTAILTLGQTVDPAGHRTAYDVFELNDDGSSSVCLIPPDTLYSDFDYLVSLTDDGAIALYQRPGTSTVELRRFTCAP
jgi:hypothetical protein